MLPRGVWRPTAAEKELPYFGEVAGTLQVHILHFCHFSAVAHSDL